jgi:putative MATE family efflux protein
VQRSPHDREILRLAIPALGALAAEPLYLLVDTAIVGHLGTPQLAALALAATVLGAVTALCNFLAYGTTAQVARLHGAGEDERAGEVAAQALWLAIAVGAAVAVACVAFAGPVMELLGGSGHTAALAARYLRLSALGLPFALVALSGQGYLRGVSDLRTPLVILIAANAANAILEVILVYGFDTGLDGSAIGTVIAQLGMGAAFAVKLLGAPARDRRPNPAVLRRLSSMGRDIVIRTGSLLAAFTVASAILARVGADSLAAHQIAFQLFVFLALVLDAIAIAGQVIVARALGAGDARTAYDAALRMCLWALVLGIGFGAVLLAATSIVPRAFTSDGDVLERARALWPLFALMQPAGAVVFALDGILIGAGDTRYLAVSMAFSSLVCFLPLALLASAQGWGVTGVWVALNVLMLARLATTGSRFLGRRWAVVGSG